SGFLVTPAGNGLTFSLLLSDTLTLRGTVSDDGLPTGGTLTISWSKISGPGTVTLGSPDKAVTTANFSTVGTYILRLAANDSEYESHLDVTVTVKQGNRAPTVNAGPDQTVTLPETAFL